MLRYGIVAATLVLSGCIGHGATGPIAHERRLIELDKADRTLVRLKMSAGELEVRGGAATLAEADFAYNVPEWKPVVTHSVNGAESDLEIAQGDGPTVFGDTENRWRLALNDGRPIDLNAHLGAGAEAVIERLEDGGRRRGQALGCPPRRPGGAGRGLKALQTGSDLVAAGEGRGRRPRLRRAPAPPASRARCAHRRRHARPPV